MKAGFEVFDFKEEDELPDLITDKFSAKLKNPSADNPANFKHQFSECVTQGSDVPRKETSSLPCMDIDATECDHILDAAIINASFVMARENQGAQEENSSPVPASQLGFPSDQQEPCPKIANHESEIIFSEQEATVSFHEAVSPGKSQFNDALSDSSSSSIPAEAKSDIDESIDDMKSDADESMNESSPSSPASSIAEDDAIFDHGMSNNCFSSNLDLENIDIAVDYVAYRDNYCSGCQVTFSCSGIKVNCSSADGDEGTFNFEIGIGDIIRIESQYLQRLRTVNVKLRILSKEAVPVDNADNSSGIEELEFATIEPNWFEMLEGITSLNTKYLALWSAVNDTDVTVDGGMEFLQRPYFPHFEEAFEDVVYPKGDSDAVSISKRDVDLLQPETFINDTIIDFYIKYLKNQIPSEEKHRFHFFNSFFFRKLADLDKDPSSASDGRAAFLRVHKWTRRVDIFGKDYIFIPVNFNLHWSLLVICHLGAVASFKDEDSRNSLRVPCVLHMDSIKGTHAGLKNLVQSYLWEEWKERQKDTSEDLSAKFLNLRFVSLELPQQENSFDCGLFLLHYLELFLMDAPGDFNPFKINKFSKFLNANWFPPAEASLKRTLIQRLISELIGSRSREVSSGDCSDEPQSDFLENNGKRTEVDFVSERSCKAVTCHGTLSTSAATQGIEITLLEASSMRNTQCVNDPGLVLQDLFGPGVGAGSLLAQCTPFDHSSSYYHLNGTMSQIEDDAETREQFGCFPSGETGFQQIGVASMQSTYAPWNPEDWREDDDSSSEVSTSDDSDVGIIENCSIGGVICQKEKSDQQRPTSMENTECIMETFACAASELLETSAGEGAEDPDKMHDGCMNGSVVFGHENPTASMHEDPSTKENGLHKGLGKAELTVAVLQTIDDDLTTELGDGVQTIDDDLKTELGDSVQTIDDNLTAELDEQQNAKRRRLMPCLEEEGGLNKSMPSPSALEGEIGLNGSLPNDLHL